MKTNSIFLFLFFFGMLSAQAQKKVGIAWKSWGQLEQALKEKPKPVFLFFEAGWCAYCKKIERDVFTKKQVIEKINAAYYALKMNAESKDTIYFEGMAFINEQAQTKRNGVHELPLLLASRKGKAFSLPATLFLDEQFTVTTRVFEYYTSAQLLAILNSDQLNR
ncbi:MAG TPA: thioredoxin family protein [Leeuwenhoekiella sp.]|nr:thioredoxin family protein [Leeuwenhoekiella sp.]